MHPDDTLECFRAHLGLWAIEPVWLQQAIRALQRGLWPLQSLDRAQPSRARDALYGLIDDVAIIRIVDQMQKGMAKLGGTSTIQTRRALRDAVAAEDVRSILLAIDSPGGMVAGTHELAEAVRLAAQKKPVVAYIEDLGASAAYWVASQAQRITANAVAQIGSIGVMAEIEDSSGLAEREGLKVTVISTGPYKGLGAPGTPVTAELVDEIAAIVEGLGHTFFQAVQQGRGLSVAQLEAVTTGQVWLAPQAKRLRLIDGIETFDEALTAAKSVRLRRHQEANATARAALAAMATRLGIDSVAPLEGDPQ